jgi:hypothetical protein
MCWIGKQSNKNIATKDIEVFKLMYWDETAEIYDPPFQRFTYKPNNTYEITNSQLGVTQMYKNYIRIDYGFHCYSNDKCFCNKTNNGTFSVNTITYNNASLEWYTDIRFANNSRYRKINDVERKPLPLKRVKCIIPKNTMYYENNEGEIVTTKIIITKECYDL